MTLISKLLPHQYQKLIIVGGGVGGWIATLIGLELPNKGTVKMYTVYVLEMAHPNRRKT